MAVLDGLIMAVLDGLIIAAFLFVGTILQYCTSVRVQVSLSATQVSCKTFKWDLGIAGAAVGKCNGEGVGP